jgi:hypothetical protein
VHPASGLVRAVDVTERPTGDAAHIRCPKGVQVRAPEGRTEPVSRVRLVHRDVTALQQGGHDVDAPAWLRRAALAIGDSLGHQLGAEAVLKPPRRRPEGLFRLGGCSGGPAGFHSHGALVEAGRVGKSAALYACWTISRSVKVDRVLWLFRGMGNTSSIAPVFPCVCGSGIKQTMDDQKVAVPFADAEHYREIARKLRGIAQECRFPKSRQELLDLAGRYERRADHFDQRTPSPISRTKRSRPAAAD